MPHNGTVIRMPPVSSGKRGGQMIVEESFENFVNVYVDGYVFTADREKRRWGFGDGNDTAEYIQAQSSRRGMSREEFMQYYQGICNAVAGWDDKRWKYRYNVVAMEGSSTQMLQDVFDHVEEMIAKDGAERNRNRCEEILKIYASRPMIRLYGLRIMKYIGDMNEENAHRIVYQMDELVPFEVESLIPPEILHNCIHRKK